MTRISILLSDDERKILFEMAQRELRALPDQARYIIRNALLNETATHQAKEKSSVQDSTVAHAAFA